MMIELRPASRADAEAVIRLNKELIDSYEDVAGIPYAYVLGWVAAMWNSILRNINAFS